MINLVPQQITFAAANTISSSTLNLFINKLRAENNLTLISHADFDDMALIIDGLLINVTDLKTLIT